MPLPCPSAHAHFQATIRLLLSLSNIAPLPYAAHITPFIFRVCQRGLRGLLSEHDSAEDGSRELAGEWVDAREDGAEDDERVILYLHGGKCPDSPVCGTGADCL